MSIAFPVTLNHRRGVHTSGRAERVAAKYRIIERNGPAASIGGHIAVLLQPLECRQMKHQVVNSHQDLLPHEQHRQTLGIARLDADLRRH